MADRAQHEVLCLQCQTLGRHILVQRENAGRLTFETGDHHAAHMHDACRVTHAKLQRAVGQVLVAAHGAGGGIDLGEPLAWHLRCLELIDRLDLGVRVHDAARRVFEHHAHRRVAEDGVHHLALALERVNELELADEHRRLTGEHGGESPRLRCTRCHPRHQQSDEPALNLDGQAERICRGSKQVEQSAHPAAARRRCQRAQELAGLIDRHPRRHLAVRRPADQMTILEQPQLALAVGERAADEPAHLGP